MKRKYLIFVGIVLLIGGILMKMLGTSGPLPLLLIILGASCKLTYLAYSITEKSYHPGWEMTLLYGGLGVFFFGIYLRKHGFDLGWIVELLGILMKMSFIFFFIRKKRRRG